MNQLFYKDFLFKKLKPKSEILENLLENTEHQLCKNNSIPSLYNVSIQTQDDVWICGRIYSENAGGGGGKLTEHNVVLQGSYVCSNSHSVPLNLTNCEEYSLFPGQIVLAHGRNPDGKRFICKEIIEPLFISETKNNNKTMIKEELSELSYMLTNDNMPSLRENNGISIKLDLNENLTVIVSAGPYMTNGTLNTNNLTNLVQVVKQKNAHVLILLGPFVDANHDLISTGNTHLSYEELLHKILEEVGEQLKTTKVQVIIQPSLNDVTQEPIYPVHPINVSNQFLKQYNNFHFLHEPSTIKLNNTLFAVTTTDIIKDLTVSAVSKTKSSDKIARNFIHLLKQRSFYPIYPPPDHVSIDFEAWNKYAKLDTQPKVFISVSDLATFVKDVNNCVCLNPGKLVKGTSTGGYAQIIINSDAKLETNTQTQQDNLKASNITATLHKI